MKKIMDVTSKVKFNPLDIDGEYLPITECICGKKFGYWEHCISIYEDLGVSRCPNCGVGLYFASGIRVYQLIEPIK